MISGGNLIHGNLIEDHFGRFWRSLSCAPPSSGTTAAGHERRTETALWVLRGTLLVREFENRLLWVLHCGCIVHRDHLFLGAVSRSPHKTYQCRLPFPCGTFSVLTLAISRRWNPLPALRRTRLRVSIWRTVLYWVVTLERM